MRIVLLVLVCFAVYEAFAFVHPSPAGIELIRAMNEMKDAHYFVSACSARLCRIRGTKRAVEAYTRAEDLMQRVKFALGEMIDDCERTSCVERNVDRLKRLCNRFHSVQVSHFRFLRARCSLFPDPKACRRRNERRIKSLDVGKCIGKFSDLKKIELDMKNAKNKKEEKKEKKVDKKEKRKEKGREGRSRSRERRNGRREDNLDDIASKSTKIVVNCDREEAQLQAQIAEEYAKMDHCAR